MKLAYVPSCKHPEFKLTPDQRTVFWIVTVVKKCIIASSGSLLVFCTAQKHDTFGSYNQTYHLCSLLFRQQGGINSVVRRVYLAITAKLVPTE